MKRFTILLIPALLLTVSMVFAAVPQLINFQGILKDGSGNPVADGSYSVVFTIYDDPTAGNILWAETTSVSTTSGLFSVLLGSTNPVPDSAFKDTSRYLGIKVGADPEMTPRQRLSSVGYSYNSSEWTSAGENLFRLNGKVAIGTSNPQSPFVVQGASNWGVAEVAGNDGFNNESSIGFRPSNLSKGALGTWVLGVNNNAGLANAFSLYVANGFGAGSQAISVLTSGNVGIGAFNPLQKLHVQGNGYLSGNLGVGTASPAAQLHVHDPSGTINGSRLMLTQTATGSTIFDGTALICGSPNRAFLWNYENGPSIFGTNNAERMRIDSVGNVGIGLNNPSKKLEVAGSIKGDTVFSNILSSNSPLELQAPAGTTRMFISDGGNVGIGTASPSEKLTVAGSMEVGTGAGDYQHLRIGGGNSSGFLYGSYPAFGDGIHLGYNYYADAAGVGVIPNTGGGTSRISLGYGSIGLYAGYANFPPLFSGLYINEIGLVGIGTTSPFYRLDVAGSAHATSFPTSS
ncbi:MAG: hypothetical protein ACM3YF_02135, partial [Candidatus Zixiibacteriota bacterium]